MQERLRHYARRGGALTVAGLLFAQFLPILSPSNPPRGTEPAWDRPETRLLARRACFDCHSNETIWPWYAHVAPMRWLVVQDVHAGRTEFNFSDWQPGVMSGTKAANEIAGGDMPLPQYLLLHPEARLSPTEKAQLSAGLVETMR